MLAAVVCWGFTAHRGLLARFLTGIGIPVLVIGFWAVLMAPNAAHRIPWPWEPAVALILFLAAAAALWNAGRPTLALVFAGLSVLNAVGVYALGQR